jgi:hypothetical protein
MKKISTVQIFESEIFKEQRLTIVVPKRSWLEISL